MNTSPVSESWEGVGAYFTFADSPAALAAILILSVAVAVVGVVISAKHENDSAKKLIND